MLKSCVSGLCPLWRLEGGSGSLLIQVVSHGRGLRPLCPCWLPAGGHTQLQGMLGTPAFLGSSPLFSILKPMVAGRALLVVPTSPALSAIASLTLVPFSSTFKGSCGYIGPMEFIQNTFPIVRCLAFISPAQFRLPCNVTYSQASGTRSWKPLLIEMLKYCGW